MFDHGRKSGGWTARVRAGAVALLAGVAGAVAVPQAEAKTLRVAIPGFPSLGMNPLTSTNLPSLYTFAAIFDSLTWVDMRGHAQPQVALSWESVDEKTWVFRLRPGLTFSNGEPLTADAVVFAVDLLRSPVGRTYTVNVEVPSLRVARAVDPLTVEITTWTPNPFLPQELSLVRLLSPSAWAKGGDEGFNHEPVGSGPFVVERRDPARMILNANPTSWRKPKVDRLELIAAPDPTTRLQSILAGRAHVAVMLGPDQIPQIEAAGHSMLVALEPAMIILAFVTVKDSPLRDVRVRRALNHAVDKQRIVDTILAGAARPASQTAPAIAFGFDSDIPPYAYDPAKARALLAEAGFADGFSIVSEIYAGTSTYAALVYQQVAADLAQVGVRLDVRVVPIPQYARGLHQGDWAGTAFGIDYNSAPSFDALRGFFRHSCMWKAPWYCDPEIMPMLNEALATFDLDKRRELTRAVLRRQRDQAPGILLHDYVRFDAVARNASGFSINTGFIPYDEIDVNE